MYFNAKSALKKTFTIIKKDASRVNTRGRAVRLPYEAYMTLQGILVVASANEIERNKQRQYPVTHTIVQDGTPKADREDILALGSRRFFIHDVNNPGEITKGIAAKTVYTVEERRDI